VVVKNAAPTVIKPLVDLSMNENFMGSSIYTENFAFGPPKPESSLGRRNTNPLWTGVSKLLNEATGGTDNIAGAIDVNPKQAGVPVRVRAWICRGLCQPGRHRCHGCRIRRRAGGARHPVRTPRDRAGAPLWRSGSVLPAP
jgi:hypothetical protein